MAEDGGLLLQLLEVSSIVTEAEAAWQERALQQVRHERGEVF